MSQGTPYRHCQTSRSEIVCFKLVESETRRVKSNSLRSANQRSLTFTTAHYIVSLNVGAAKIEVCFLKISCARHIYLSSSGSLKGVRRNSRVHTNILSPNPHSSFAHMVNLAKRVGVGGNDTMPLPESTTA